LDSLTLFFLVEGAHTILPTSFFFSLLVVLDELASPGKLLWQCDHRSMAAIYLGIGHITGWSDGDRVRQVALQSQQANRDVINVRMTL